MWREIPRIVCECAIEPDEYAIADRRRTDVLRKRLRFRRRAQTGVPAIPPARQPVPENIGPTIVQLSIAATLFFHCGRQDSESRPTWVRRASPCRGEFRSPILLPPADKAAGSAIRWKGRIEPILPEG